MIKSIEEFVDKTSQRITNYIFKDIVPKKRKSPLNGEIKKMEDLSNVLYLMEIERNAKYMNR